MTDEVNNPTHYNRNGIEVIDVIETYAKDDFRLANVIKYVCRCEYKGKKLQDLQKAQWYLQRVLDELVEGRASIADRDPRTARTGYTPREVEVFFQGYECREQEEAEEVDVWRNEPESPFQGIDDEISEALQDEGWMEDPAPLNQDLYIRDDDYPADATYESATLHPSPDRIAGDDAAEEESGHYSLSFDEIGRYATMGAGPIPEKVYEIPYNPQGAHNKFCEEQEAHLPPDRIAGDTSAAQRIKDEYYNFDRFEIKGYCAECDRELLPTQPHVTSGEFEKSIKFCSITCMNRLREWQGR